MIAQEGIGYDKQGRPPIRYNALEKCLGVVANLAQSVGASVHLPRIGTGLAGGHWSVIGKLIEHKIVTQRVPVVVYDLPERNQGG